MQDIGNLDLGHAHHGPTVDMDRQLWDSRARCFSLRVTILCLFAVSLPQGFQPHRQPGRQLLVSPLTRSQYRSIGGSFLRYDESLCFWMSFFTTDLFRMFSVVDDTGGVHFCTAAGHFHQKRFGPQPRRFAKSSHHGLLLFFRKVLFRRLACEFWSCRIIMG